MINKPVLALAALLLTASTASAATPNYPKNAYDAKYDITNPQGKSSLRMASDGQGHTLTESKVNGQSYKTLVDYTAGTSTTLIEQGKMAMKSKLPPNSNGGYIADESSAKAQGGKPLGAKVVNGHPCHGYEFNNAGVKSQTWIGDDCKVMVQSITDSSAGKTTMDLKSVGGAPGADTFKVPSGYKVMGQ